jgi:hypothetical protein
MAGFKQFGNSSPVSDTQTKAPKPNMKSNIIAALTITILAGSFSVSKAAVFQARTDRKDSVMRVADDFVAQDSLAPASPVAGASGDRPGDHSMDVMKKSSKKSSSKKSKAS